jgi:hypothetical protein
MAAGECVCALALDETPRHDPDAVALRGAKAKAGVLDGEKSFVLDGQRAPSADRRRAHR